MQILFYTRIIAGLLFARRRTNRSRCSCTFLLNARIRSKGQMMNNLMFYPFVTGSVSVIFARYKPDERGATSRGGPTVSCTARYPGRCQMPKNTRQKHCNIIISMIYGAAHPFLNGQHLSSDADDAGCLLSFDFPPRALSCS